MGDQLTDFLKKLRLNPNVPTFDEASAKQGIILPILHLLGWNTFSIDEVTPEYSVENRKVDFALRIENKNKVFLEAKKPSEELDKHEDQLLEYSFRQGVELAILTKRTVWWFYLPLKKGDWKARKFYAIDIMAQELNEIASKFSELLLKNNVQSGKANENAEFLYKGRMKKRTVEKTLPEAWNTLVSEPDSLLVDLLVETTEKLCGYRPEDSEAREMLTKFRENLMLKPEKTKVKPPVQTTEISAGIQVTQAGYFKSIDAYKQKRIQDNILNRRKLWEVFIEKKELTASDFKSLSHFEPKAIAGFMKFITMNGIANRFGDNFKLKKDAIPQIRKLLKEGLPRVKIQTSYFESIDPYKQNRIQDNILNRQKLWREFIKKKKMTADEFKAFSHFEPKSIAGFMRFITVNGIATRLGDTFEIVDDVISPISKMLK